ncbi:glycosyltransferase [Flavobacterium wongokense]|uniref:glycosyltransferase n=1 Tax=Flavobacterium wongokense TaxID=2910674 RepID=UPI001F2757F6|nr:glycosyltransferase [Flavobacterium sp. WG47]MCF6133111.1 glycosyltransferase [Flavobacterium sp. WG47]
MNYQIIIPAHNEEKDIDFTLHSLTVQSVLPKNVLIVNDNSIDGTQLVIDKYIQRFPNLFSSIRLQSEAKHLPGSKVINAFNHGYKTIDTDFDIIVKADADLIFPTNYFETIIKHFESDDTIGMVGGFAYIHKNGDWILENLTDKDHIRGAFKAYRKECFEQIGGLKPAMGWDTVDELLCKFYNWKVVTDESLKVKHLKPTGANYNKEARYKQGEAFYSLGYGFLITSIASLKLAMRKGKPMLFLDYLNGFRKAQSAKKPLLVTKEQAQFIRNYRWKKMKEKLF